MSGTDPPPPRKRSRFFPSREDQSVASRAQERHNHGWGIRAGHKDKMDDRDSSDIDNHVCHRTTSGDNSMKSMMCGTETGLPQCLATTSCSSITPIQSATALSQQHTHERHQPTSPALRQQINTKESRRHGIYGAQTLGLVVTESASPALNMDYSYTAIGLETRCYSGGNGDHHYQTSQPALQTLRAPFQPYILSPFCKQEGTLRGQLPSPPALPSMSLRHQASETSCSDSRVSSSSVKTASTQSQPVSRCSENDSGSPVSSASLARSFPGHGEAVRGCTLAHPLPQNSLGLGQSGIHQPGSLDKSSSLQTDGTPKLFSHRVTDKLPRNNAQCAVEHSQDMQLAHRNTRKHFSHHPDILHHSKPHTHNSYSLSSAVPKLTMNRQSALEASHNHGSNIVQEKEDEIVSGVQVNRSIIDLDRDAAGTLLPFHLRQFPAQYNVRSSAHKDPATPANLYTSPKRIENAITASSLKRIRMRIDLPPPAHIYQRSEDPNFNIFANGILLYPELCFALASQMQLRDLVSLYAISKDFHTIIDSRFTTTCLIQALRKAPQSAKTFQFRSYGQYCRQDPAARIAHPNPAMAARSIPRSIPSFRWVAFVFHREKVVHELITVFAERGCPLPARCGLALKRMWMLMDIPDNARRIALIHNHRVITDLDLYFMMCFFVKLDMLTNDPVAAEKNDGLRKLLLSQRSGLDIMLKVLKRDTWQKQSDLIHAWIKTSMSLGGISEEELDDLNIDTILGVPRDEVGQGKYEYWGLKGINDKHSGRKRSHLLRPDQLVMREAIRRGITFSKHFMKCIFYGYIRPDTLQDYEPRKYGRRIGEWGGDDYDINDDVGNSRALSVEDGGDLLLDLGDTGRGSRYTIQKEAVGDQERAMRDGQAEALEMLYEISEREQI